MAAVVLNFAGDSTKLDKAFSSIEANSKAMASTVGAQSSKVAGSFDKMSDRADKSEGKFIGVADVASGLGDILGVEALGPMAAYGTALADLSGGFAQLGPMIGQAIAKFGAMIGITTAETVATEGAAVAQWNLNAAMLANPIGLIVLGIAALGALFFVLWNKCDAFRDAMIRAWEFMKKWIPQFWALGKAIDFVKGLFSDADAKVKKSAEIMAEHAKKIDDAVLILNNGVGVSREAWDKWGAQVQKSVEDILNPLERARESSKVTFAEINANLIDNAKFFDGWVNNLAILTNRGFAQLALDMQQLGPSAEKAVGEMITMSDAKLGDMQKLFAERAKTIGGEGASELKAAIAGADWSGLGRMIAIAMGVDMAGTLNRIMEETISRLRDQGATIGVTMGTNVSRAAPAPAAAPANNVTVNVAGQVADPHLLAKEIMWNLTP